MYEYQHMQYHILYGEIKRFIRDDGPIKVSRSIKELAMKIIEIQRENLNKTGKELQINELAKRLGIEKENIVVAMDAIKRPESIDEEIYDEVGGETKASRISTNKDETEKTINKLCVQELIEELNEDEKQIILLRYYKGKTQAEVAQRLKISQVQVSRIEKKTLLKMRSKIA